MLDVLASVSQVAPTSSAVLLLGETGTGKELLAHAIHDHSARRSGPFVKVNCAALPQTLIETELFGHEKGAFTGATGPKSGRFEVADGGTLFLDEIGELTPEIQVKLLGVLQDGQFERVGSTRTRTANARIVAATNRDLGRAMAEGRFREDLYYRLSVFPIQVPPLRERREDIPLLVWGCINRRQAQIGRKIERIPDRAMAALKAYEWPGNIRELENVIERALILSTGSTLRLEETLGVTGRRAAAPAPPQRLDELDRAHIERVVEASGWRIHGKGNAAQKLGLHPNTLRSRMQKLGITRPARPS
jgi:transcriptional regulator with GAF, ATPase, and Fis domain